MMVCLDWGEIQIWVGILLGVSITLAVLVGHHEYRRWRRR